MQKQEGHVKTEADIGVVLLWAREHQEPPDVGREGKNKIILQSLRREPGPANTLISVQPWTSDLQNHKLINSCCF